MKTLQEMCLEGVYISLQRDQQARLLLRLRLLYEGVNPDTLSAIEDEAVRNFARLNMHRDCYGGYSSDGLGGKSLTQVTDLFLKYQALKERVTSGIRFTSCFGTRVFLILDGHYAANCAAGLFVSDDITMTKVEFFTLFESCEMEAYVVTKSGYDLQVGLDDAEGLKRHLIKFLDQ